MKTCTNEVDFPEYALSQLPFYEEDNRVANLRFRLSQHDVEINTSSFQKMLEEVYRTLDYWVFDAGNEVGGLIYGRHKNNYVKINKFEPVCGDREERERKIEKGFKKRDYLGFFHSHPFSNEYIRNKIGTNHTLPSGADIESMFGKMEFWNKEYLPIEMIFTAPPLKEIEELEEKKKRSFLKHFPEIYPEICWKEEIGLGVFMYYSEPLSDNNFWNFIPNLVQKRRMKKLKEATKSCEEKVTILHRDYFFMDSEPLEIDIILPKKIRFL